MKLINISREKYENMFIVIAGISGLAFLILCLWIVNANPVLSAIILPISFVLGFLYLKSYEYRSYKEDPRLFVGAMLIASIACACILFLGSHKVIPEIENVFVKGDIVAHTYYSENDEGPGGAYKTSYLLNPTNPKHQIFIEIISWSMGILSIIMIGLLFKFYSKAMRLYQTGKFRDKNPRWEGDIPEHLLEKIQ